MNIADAAIDIYERKYPELSDLDLFVRMRENSYGAYAELRGINVAYVLNQCWRCIIEQRNEISLASLQTARHMVDTIFTKFWDRRKVYTDTDDLDEVLSELITETCEEIFVASKNAQMTERSTVIKACSWKEFFGVS